MTTHLRAWRAGCRSNIQSGVEQNKSGEGKDKKSMSGYHCSARGLLQHGDDVILCGGYRMHSLTRGVAYRLSDSVIALFVKYKNRGV